MPYSAFAPLPAKGDGIAVHPLAPELDGVEQRARARPARATLRGAEPALSGGALPEGEEWKNSTSARFGDKQAHRLKDVDGMDIAGGIW